MRKLVCLVAVLVGAVALDAAAQNSMQLVMQQLSVAAGASNTAAMRCPASYLPIDFSVNGVLKDSVTYSRYAMVDKSGKHVDLSTLPDGSSLSGGGFEVETRNNGNAHSESFVLQILCQRVVGPITWIRQTAIVPPVGTASAVAFCPTGSATAAITNAGESALDIVVNGPVFGTPQAPIHLIDVTQPKLAAAHAWEVVASNPLQVVRTVIEFVACQDLGQDASWEILRQVEPDDAQVGIQIFVPVPDGDAPYGTAAALPPGSRPLHNFLTWHDDGDVPMHDYAAGRGPAAGVLLPQGRIQEMMFLAAHPPPSPPVAAVAKAGSVLVAAVLSVPKTTPPPASVATVVEFYNAGLDHYFITAAPAEIADLDNGVHKGWTRTGQSFHTYGARSTGAATRQPVCRAYGNPAAGLDSHFYSASMSECYDTLEKFAGSWLLEASEVFQMDLPDTGTGVCPPGDVPVYRVFNNRADVNHRYTTSAAIRDQMVGRGYVAEGYGPDNVTLCALP